MEKLSGHLPILEVMNFVLSIRKTNNLDNILWILFSLFLFFDLLFASVRAGYVHVRLPHLINLREQNPKGVELALKLLERPFFSASLRVGLALMHFLLAGVTWMLYLRLSNQSAELPAMLGFLFLLGLLLLIMEFALEGFILRHTESWAIRFAPAANIMEILFRPVSWLLMAILGSPAALQRSMGAVTEDELKTWVEEGQLEGSLEKDERKMIYSIFHFSDTLCREIMVPRIDVFALDVETQPAEATQAVLLSGHSRVPVYEETVDNVIGLLYAKDLLKLQADERKIGSLRELVRQAYFVPEAKKVDELLSEMQARGVHMVVVVDEYGGTAGLVTLEDIVEEIVGEIRDEYDQSEELLYQQINEHEYIFHGRIDLDDFNELLGTHLTKEVADTLGGYIYGEIGRVPVGGEQLEVDDWTLSVDQVSGRRIRLVRATRSGPEMEEEGKNGIDQ